MSHTPGPWTLPQFDRANKVIAIDEPRVEIDYDDVDHHTQEANAHLIAAAPELLDFVKRQYSKTVCICGLQNTISEYMKKIEMPRLNCTHCEAAYLIAKAEGQ